MPSPFYARLSPLAILVLGLAAAGLGIAGLKAVRLHVPLLPEDTSTVWTIQARVSFEGTGGPSKVTFALPLAESMPRVIDEHFVSRRYGLAIVDDGAPRREAIWTLRRTPETPQTLYYQVKVLPGVVGTSPEVPPFPPVPDYQEPLASAIDTVLSRARAQSADVFSFTEQLLRILRDSEDENVKLIHDVEDQRSWPHLVAQILAGARIPTRIAYGIPLARPATDLALMPWLEVHNGSEWRGYDARSGRPVYPDNFFIWRYGQPDLVRVMGAREIEVGFSTLQTRIPTADLHDQRGPAYTNERFGIDLTQLPIEVQTLYRVLLMLPLGAIVVAFMRVVIGIPTFGTFMPILIALAFRETELGWGIVLFLALIFVGLALRLTLASLRLLLVPRLAAMLTVVVCLMLGVTLLSYRLGIEQGLSVALFPMVILAMTIERMSIVWEERGPRETAKETLGSLVVAIAGFYVMNEPHLEHLMFYFPELLLPALSVSLLLGAYTGYRLTELVRFGVLREDR